MYENISFSCVYLLIFSSVRHVISFTHHLPDNLFASPTKSAGENQSSLAQASAEDDGMPFPNDTPLLPGGSPLTMASLKSCYLQMPR